MLFLWILIGVVIAIVSWLVFWSLVTIIIKQSKYHKQFLNGTTPQTAPDGFYQGTAHLLFDQQTPWLGKSFNRLDSEGFNIFTPAGASLLKILTPFYKRFALNNDGNTDAYYFKTRTEPALKDAPLNVIKLDYNSPENPFLIRIILDEIVEIAPEQYLGKVHLKVFPNVYSMIGYFGLRKKKS